MSIAKTSLRNALLIAAVLGAAGLMSGCVYEQPAYPSYAQAYPGGYYGYDYPYYGPTVGLGFGFGDHDEWHEHHHWHHWH